MWVISELEYICLKSRITIMWVIMINICSTVVDLFIPGTRKLNDKTRPEMISSELWIHGCRINSKRVITKIDMALISIQTKLTFWMSVSPINIPKISVNVTGWPELFFFHKDSMYRLTFWGVRSFNGLWLTLFISSSFISFGPFTGKSGWEYSVDKYLAKQQHSNQSLSGGH